MWNWVACRMASKCMYPRLWSMYCLSFFFLCLYVRVSVCCASLFRVICVYISICFYHRVRLLQNAHRFLQSLCEVCIFCGLNIANKRIKKNSSQRERGKKIRNIEMQKKNMKTTMWTRRLNATRIINKILSDSAKYRPAKWQIKEHLFAQPGKLV